MLVALFYFDGHWVRWIACALFTAACITDYFDGYFARAWRQIDEAAAETWLLQSSLSEEAREKVRAAEVQRQPVQRQPNG